MPIPRRRIVSSWVTGGMRHATVLPRSWLRRLQVVGTGMRSAGSGSDAPLREPSPAKYPRPSAHTRPSGQRTQRTARGPQRRPKGRTRHPIAVRSGLAETTSVPNTPRDQCDASARQILSNPSAERSYVLAKSNRTVSRSVPNRRTLAACLDRPKPSSLSLGSSSGTACARAVRHLPLMQTRTLGSASMLRT